MTELQARIDRVINSDNKLNGFILSGKGVSTVVEEMVSIIKEQKEKIFRLEKVLSALTGWKKVARLQLKELQAQLSDKDALIAELQKYKSMYEGLCK